VRHESTCVCYSAWFADTVDHNLAVHTWYFGRSNLDLSCLFGCICCKIGDTVVFLSEFSICSTMCDTDKSDHPKVPSAVEAEITGFDSSKLKHTDCQEKTCLPSSEGWTFAH
jgi:Thymosin beta-4 family